MWAKHPKIAREWTDKYGSSIGGMKNKRKRMKKSNMPLAMFKKKER